MLIDGERMRGEEDASQRIYPLVMRGLDPRIPAPSTYTMAGWVYIMANRPNGAIYVGATSELVQRVWQHKNEVVPSHTEHYNVHNLVYFEEHATMPLALQREHTMKHWKRVWKVALIEQTNPKWNDLYSSIIG